MISSRNTSSHAYDQETAETIFRLIFERYFAEFQDFHANFAKRRDEEA
jgi:hypothetical protein